jgi:hypothetical protein
MGCGRRVICASDGAIEHNLSKLLGDIKACIDFKMLEVKVPLIFLHADPPQMAV